MHPRIAVVATIKDNQRSVNTTSETTNHEKTSKQRSQKAETTATAGWLLVNDGVGYDIHQRNYLPSRVPCARARVQDGFPTCYEETAPAYAFRAASTEIRYPIASKRNQALDGYAFIDVEGEPVLEHAVSSVSRTKTGRQLPNTLTHLTEPSGEPVFAGVPAGGNGAQLPHAVLISLVRDSFRDHRG